MLKKLKKLLGTMATMTEVKMVFCVYFFTKYYTFNEVAFVATVRDHMYRTGVINTKKALVNCINECLTNIGCTHKCSYRQVVKCLAMCGISESVLVNVL